MHASVLTLPLYVCSCLLICTSEFDIFCPPSPTDTTFSLSCTRWESSESCSPFMLLCRSYADLECSPWGSPTSTTCHLTTTTASSSSCCPISHVRGPILDKFTEHISYIYYFVGLVTRSGSIWGELLLPMETLNAVVRSQMCWGETTKERMPKIKQW